MSSQMTSEGTPSAIFSQESQGGALRHGWPDGQTTDLFGVVHAPASPSRLPGREQDFPTTGISGPSGNHLSRSCDLQSSLESNLRQRLLGSRLFEVIWKRWATPWGQYLSKPRVRALTTGGIGGGSLPTPSGTSNHGKNHVAGRLDEWGGSSNLFRGTSLGNVHCPAFELWVMGFPDEWAQLMPPAMPSSRKSRRK